MGKAKRSLDWLPENLRSYYETGVLKFGDETLEPQAQITGKHIVLEICDLIHDEGLKTGLEIGVLLGVSTCILASALKANGGSLIGVDPGRPDEKWGDGRIKDPFSFAEQLVTDSGLRGTVTLIRDYSYNIFHELKKDHFDFVYIDGDHNYFGVLADFIASDYCLREGGYIIMDDVNKVNAMKDWTDGGPARLLPMIFASGRFEMRYMASNTMVCRKLKSVS